LLKSKLSLAFELILSASKKNLTRIFLFFYSHERLNRAIDQALNEARLHRLRSSLKSCGHGLSVQFPITITEPQLVEMGERVSLAAYVHIWGGGEVSIGDRVMIGTHTSITSLTHDYKQKVMRNTLIRKRVIIEDDVWISSNCVILPGVKIGRGAVIGAGSVVTKNVDPHAVVFGVPAERRLER
jgi:maltose O-acetyltransferase